MEELIQLVLKTYGLVGLVLIAPGAAAWYFWKETVRLNNEKSSQQSEFAKSIDEMGQRVVAAQEKRVDDSQKLTNDLIELISEHTAAQKETNLALEKIGDMVANIRFPRAAARGEKGRGE